MPVRIGIPRGMYFYKYYPFINTFLTEIGAEVVPSPETTKEILDKGVLYSIDDACLPVKVYHGHAYNLRNNADFILIPRLTSVSRNEYICPKFGGLPEMVKYSVPGLPPVIDTEVNMIKYNSGLTKALYHIAFRLNVRNPISINRAISKAFNTHSAFRAMVAKGITPDRIIDSKSRAVDKSRFVIGVVGHPYLLYDNFVSMKLIYKLEDKGMRVVTPEMIDPHIINERCKELSKRMYWSSGKNLIGGALYIMDNSSIDGMLMLTAFGCGVDSLAGEFIEKYARKHYNKPYMILNIDEHTGDAGFNTRLEAFTDLLNWRNANAAHIPSHGRSIHSS
ncbi:MAG: acyl-CoA dehydratase activase-related protein [Caulobacteraceae bacterium]